MGCFLKGLQMEGHALFTRLGEMPTVLRDALKLTLELKRTFDDRRPIAEALSGMEQRHPFVGGSDDATGLKMPTHRRGPVS
ncbi:MAG: hypothetical protein M0009_00380 [Deltaproteobacteria bacterium]|nr:hypothetical protein [Deltaproteobacteria bacterium]